MSVAVAPSATFEAVANFGVTGLAGTIGIRLLNNAGGTTIARVTAGITEFPAGSGIYTKSYTAPGTRGQYTLLWDDGAVTPGHIFTEDLLVTSTYPAVVSVGSLYVTRDQLKATLGLTGTSQDNQIDVAVEAASRAIDNVAETKFYPASETRYYEPEPRDRELYLGDLTAVTAVGVDNDGDGDYADETWVEGTDYYLSPRNAALDDTPYNTLVLLRPAGRRFPYYQQGIRVAGTFGWANVPTSVAQYAEILASRLLRRAREAPLGFALNGAEQDAAAIVRRDPDFDTLVGPYIRRRLLV